MAVLLELSSMKFYEEAKKMLDKKDLIEFISKVSIAIEASRNDKQMLAETTYLKARGLVTFNQHLKALDSIAEALKYNIGAKALELKKYEGVIKGYLGKENEARVIFKELIHKSDDINVLVGIYINIVWINLILNKNKPDDQLLEEVKYYLDLAKQNIDSLPNNRKFKIFNNYSVYYFYKGNYEKAIDILKNSIKHCDEMDLPHIYNNLAELIIKSTESENVRFFETANEYLEKAAILGTKYDNNISLGYTYRFRAEIELRKDQLFTALDTLYLSIEYFKNAEAYSCLLECVQEINKIIKKVSKIATNVTKLELTTNYHRKEPFIAKSFKTYNFCRHKKIFEFVAQRINNENKIEEMNLRIYEGVVNGYLGNLDKAINIFKDVIGDAEDQTVITTSCLNIAWLYMSLDRKTLDEHKLTEAKKYLDLVYDQFTSLPYDNKYNLLSYYGVYYYLKDNYNKSIEFFKNSIKYCDEKYLADLYNNIAELYINSTDDNSLSEITRDYLEKAEGLGTKYDETLSLGQTFYLKAEIELREDQFFTALDTLYLSYEYFKQAKSPVLACECLIKINELMDRYKQDHLESLKNNSKTNSLKF